MTRDDTSPARGYSWPPAAPGNDLATVHGANSERRIAPRAAQIAAELLSHPDTPRYLHEPSYAPVIHAWARAEAVVALLWDWLAEHDIDAALTDLTTTDEDHQHRKSGSRKRTVSHHIESVLTQLHRHEVRAMNLRSRLGLDPLSRARLGKDVASQQFDVARMFAQMAAEDEGKD